MGKAFSHALASLFLILNLSALAPQAGAMLCNFFHIRALSVPQLLLFPLDQLRPKAIQASITFLGHPIKIFVMNELRAILGDAKHLCESDWHSALLTTHGLPIALVSSTL